MSNMQYIWTTPTSNSQLRKYAKRIRKMFNCDEELYFPVLKILDYLMDEGAIIFQILDDNDPYFLENELAKFDFYENCIYAKESVYLEAIQDIGRSRFTLTHELAHYILLRLLNFESYTMDSAPLAFQDPEWQANTLARELLIPYDLSKNLSILEIIDECKVSEECALVNYDRLKNALGKG